MAGQASGAGMHMQPAGAAGFAWMSDAAGKRGQAELQSSAWAASSLIAWPTATAPGTRSAGCGKCCGRQRTSWPPGSPSLLQAAAARRAAAGAGAGRRAVRRGRGSAHAGGTSPEALLRLADGEVHPPGCAAVVTPPAPAQLPAGPADARASRPSRRNGGCHATLRPVPGPLPSCLIAATPTPSPPSPPSVLNSLTTTIFSTRALLLLTSSCLHRSPPLPEAEGCTPWLRPFCVHTAVFIHACGA